MKHTYVRPHSDCKEDGWYPRECKSAKIYFWSWNLQTQAGEHVIKSWKARFLLDNFQNVLVCLHLTSGDFLEQNHYEFVMGIYIIVC